MPRSTPLRLTPSARCRGGPKATEPMVETANGLEHAADILAVPGIDGVFFGPYDLSISPGYPSPDSPQTIQALRHLIQLVRTERKIARRLRTCACP